MHGSYSIVSRYSVVFAHQSHTLVALERGPVFIFFLLLRIMLILFKSNRALYLFIAVELLGLYLIISMTVLDPAVGFFFIFMMVVSSLFGLLLLVNLVKSHGGETVNF